MKHLFSLYVENKQTCNGFRIAIFYFAIFNFFSVGGMENLKTGTTLKKTKFGNCFFRIILLFVAARKTDVDDCENFTQGFR